MKSFLLAAKVTFFFALVVLMLLGGVGLLFHRLAGHEALDHETLMQVHHAFVSGLWRIGLLALVSVMALALYLTAPLRRMSRSMNRIASGELDHRVDASGRDEVAVMGRSFNKMAERIQVMVNGQKELMAGVSHELRSPLARLKMSVELLRQGGSDAHPAGEPAKTDSEAEAESGIGTGRRLDEIEAEIDTLDELVGELLLLSHLDFGAVSVHPEPARLEELVEQAWRRVADEAAERGVRLETEIGEDAARLLADRKLTVRALGNLFENAVRYAAPGAIRVTARCVPLHQRRRVEVTVADQGPGVAQEALPHLFEPFFRADRSRSRKTGAHGLGLMIVRRAIEAQGGTVGAEAGSPRGLIVRFDLGAAPEH